MRRRRGQRRAGLPRLPGARRAAPCALALLTLFPAAWAPQLAAAAPEGGPPAPATLSAEAGARWPDDPAWADSVWIDRIDRIEGGSILSTREARRRLLAGAPAGRLAVSSLHARLSELGAGLLDAGRFEAGLELRIVPGGEAWLIVEDGPSAVWDTLRYSIAEGAAGLPPPRRPRRGEPFRAARLEEAFEDWIEEAVERGFPFASVRVESLRVVHGRVDGGIRFDSGPRAEVREITFPGRASVDERVLRRAARMAVGELYRESRLERGRRGLERTGLFVRVEDPSVVWLGEGGVRIELPVEEARHNRIEGALGYSGRSETFSGHVDLLLGNLFGDGRRLAARWDRPVAAQGRLRLEWWEPYLGPLPAGLRASLEQEDRDSTFARLVLDGRLEAILGEGLTVFAGAEYHRSILGSEPAERVRRLSSILGGGWQTVRPGRWRGESLEVTVRSGRSHVRRPDGETQTYRLDRASVAVERYQPLPRFVGRVRLSGEALGREASLPVSDALRFGGGATLRGYAEEAFTTQRYLALSAEWGPAFSGQRAYLFADGGWFREFATGRSSDRWGIGLGASAETAWRRFTLDLGLPRGGGPGDLRLHLRLENRF